jgi:hypothetical protein
MNYNINSSGLYDIDSYNLTATNATVLSTLNVAGNIIGSGTALSNLNYWSKSTSTNDIYYTIGSVGIGTSTPSSVLEIANIYYNNFQLKFGSKSTHGANSIFSNGSFRFFSSYPFTNTDIIAVFGTTSNYSNPLSNSTLIYATINTQGMSIVGKLDTTTNINVGKILNVSGTTTLNNSVTCLSSLNVVGDINTSGLSVFTMNSNINNLNATSTTIFNNLNLISTYSKLNIDNLNATSTTLLSYINNLTNPSTLNVNNLNVSGTTKLNNSTTCISSLNVSGITTLQGNLDCGGGIAINGSNAFYIPFGTIDAANLTNTYLNLKVAGTNDDWCYLRQIGTVDNYKLTFDFHDSKDARFCLRSVESVINPDTITEVFTIDNGNVSCTGTLNISGSTTLNSNTTCMSSLNVVGNITTSGLSVFNINSNLSSLSTNSTLSINNLNSTSTTLLSYINNLTNPSTLTTNNLNVSATTKLNNSTTCISSLNVSGTTTLSGKLASLNRS